MVIQILYILTMFGHLKKTLYGLKQTPRAQFQRLSDILITIGFTCSRSNSSLFIFVKGSSMLYLLVYVDDFILTINTPKLFISFISRLSKECAIKYFGKLSYFLGILKFLNR